MCIRLCIRNDWNERQRHCIRIAFGKLWGGMVELFCSARGASPQRAALVRCAGVERMRDGGEARSAGRAP